MVVDDGSALLVEASVRRPRPEPARQAAEAGASPSCTKAEAPTANRPHPRRRPHRKHPPPARPRPTPAQALSPRQPKVSRRQPGCSLGHPAQLSICRPFRHRRQSTDRPVRPLPLSTPPAHLSHSCSLLLDTVPQITAIGDHADKKAAERLCALSALYQLHDLGLVCPLLSPHTPRLTRV